MNSVWDWNYYDLKLCTTANYLNVSDVDVVIVDVFIIVVNDDVNIVVVVVWFQDCQTFKSVEILGNFKKGL